MKILMTLMGLEIGGAETHVVELSKELAARGHEIVVASSGGVYVSELERAGIRHVKLPLHSKKPSALIVSLRGLRRLILNERFDLVHAHARIPAFVCGILARQMGFRFVTSTHGVYKVGPLLTRFTNWGEHAVAVSCDIKQYLIDNYKMPSDNITVTINGIDTARFSRDTDSSGVRAEFGLSDDAFRVVYCSRIDTEAALAGFLLCDAAERLGSELPGLEILMVGAGTAFERLKQRADEVNRSVGREIIRLTGARTDVANLIAAGDVFVGVSRAALEAMSEEKPVVLAGAQGYIGIFDAGVRALAESTNFCCRGERLPDADLLCGDLRRLYAMSGEERRRLGKYNRSVILEGYSVARMADDYLKAYAKLPTTASLEGGEIIVSGYYGFGNMGDDSLLSAMLAGIRSISPDAKITVLTNSPKRTARDCGVRTINRFNLPSVASEMKRARLLISGGGSLLQDGTSKKSLLYYVYIMRMAKKRGLKLMLYANGLGPLGRDSSRRLAAEIMRDADYISLRERKSRELAIELGIESDRLNVSADPAFLVKPAEPDWIDHIIRREGIEGRCFIVSVKEGNNFGGEKRGERQDVVGRVADDLRAIAERYSLTPLFVPMHSEKDAAVTNALCETVGVGKVLPGLTATELCGLMSRCELVIGTRLHMLIFAASMGVPMIGISYDPKIDAFLDYIGQSDYCCDVRTLEPGQLTAAADSIMSRRDELRAGLRETAAKLRARAMSDCERAAELIKDKEQI